VLDLSVVRLTTKIGTWTLLDLVLKRAWMFLLKAEEGEVEKRLLYCSWNVNFS